jgi:hypothetical protein
MARITVLSGTLYLVLLSGCFRSDLAREGGEQTCQIGFLYALSECIEQKAIAEGSELPVSLPAALARWHPSSAEAAELLEHITFMEKKYVKPAARGRIRLRVMSDPSTVASSECIAYVAKRFSSADGGVLIGLTGDCEIVEMHEEPLWPSKELDELLELAR